jgi:hypothetical protein
MRVRYMSRRIIDQYVQVPRILGVCMYVFVCIPSMCVRMTAGRQKEDEKRNDNVRKTILCVGELCFFFPHDNDETFVECIFPVLLLFNTPQKQHNSNQVVIVFFFLPCHRNE